MVTAKWLRRDGAGRIFVLSGGGTLLVNYTAGKGYTVEPGSTDAEYLS